MKMKQPEWLEDESTDLSSIRSLLKQIKNNNNKNSKKTDYLLKKIQEEIIKAIKSYSVPKIDDEQDKEFLRRQHRWISWKNSARPERT